MEIYIDLVKMKKGYKSKGIFIISQYQNKTINWDFHFNSIILLLLLLLLERIDSSS